MSGSTSVPQPTFGPTGFVAPAESDILTGRQADFDAAFGTTLNHSLTTPQGQLASSDAAIIGDCYDQFTALANGVDPAYAAGRMQDAIGRIYFISRIPAAATVVQAACTGATGTVIPVGALIRDAAGNQYAATAGGTIDGTGTITLAFACTATGAIACPAQTFTIVRAIPGWDTAISSAAGTEGNDVETRDAFELRRAQSVAVNALGTIPAITAALLSVPGVLDVFVTDNSTGSPVTTGGVTIAAHSIYAAVTGGLAADVAFALWKKKPPGCGYTGNTTVTVLDTISGYNSPPSYSVTFQIPTPTTIKFAVSIANGSTVPGDAAAQIQAAIISAFSGGDGGPRARIGSTIYASRFYAPVAALGSWVQIISIQVGTTTANLNDVVMNINQAPVTSAPNITVTLV
jgi:hypothetical protein